MKKKMLNNLGLKILSIVCAIILWIVVMNVSDSRITARIDDIPVEILNGEVLEQLDKIYDIQKGDTVDIIVKGKRSVVEKLTAKNFRATADLSTMSITNTVQIMVEATNVRTGEEVSITCVDNTMVLSLEEKISKQFPIKIVTVGTPKAGYAVGEVSSTPNIITIEGPESAVNKIVEISATVNVEGASSDCKSVCEINPYDAYGEIVVNDRIKMSQYTVDSTIKIYPDKEVPVNISIKGNAGNGYEVADVIFEPHNMLITGPKDILAKVDSIDIDNVSISGLTENYETTIDVNEYLPEGVMVAQADSNVVISVVIEKVIENKYPLTDKDITLKNTNTDYEYSLKLSSEYEFVLSGLEDKIDGIKLIDLAPYIDCKELKLGDNFNVELQYKGVDGVTCKTVGTITVAVSEKNGS